MRWIEVAIVLSSLAFTPALLADHHIKVDVQLNPLGEFSVTAPTIAGQLTKKGDRFEARELTVAIASLQTGIPLRDEHLRKRLGWPEQKAVVVRDVVLEKDKGVATITINKKTAPVTFKVTERLQEKVKVSFGIRLADFDIKNVRYLNVGVEDEVLVEATISYES